MARYRPWLYGAAVYNLCWGFGAVLLADSSGWKVVGMMVAVYAPAYWWLGYAAGVATGAAPAALGFVVLANDLVWWPAFVGFVRSAARAAGGWRALLVG